MSDRPDYGLDAPGVQRGLFWGGLAAWLTGVALLGVGPARLPVFVRVLIPSMVSGGLSCFLTGGIMWWGSKVGKLRLRDKILAPIVWRGDERVLDVGCGHGMMLLGAAKRLTSGRAVGVDIWSQVDQAQNSAAATIENARREDVAERIALSDADARNLPFGGSSFDVVLSSFAIHNISNAAGRRSAILEMARVLKPGGSLAVADIGRTAEYANVLRRLGWTAVSRSLSSFIFVIPLRVLRATKPE